MKVFALRSVVVSDGVNKWVLKKGEEHDLPDDVARKAIEQGAASEILGERAPAPKTKSAEFEKIGDISEALPIAGEGEQVEIESLIGQEIAVIEYGLSKGRSGELKGRNVAMVQILRHDGTRVWCTTWSEPLINQLEALKELNALPKRCVIRQHQGKQGFRYYTLDSARAVKK